VHTESLLETRFLQLTRYARLPTPRLQHRIIDEGQQVARADFAWLDSDLLVETIGRKDHGLASWQFDRDARRENRVTRLRKYTLLKFTWNDVHRESEQVCRTVAEALRLRWPPQSARVIAATGEFAARLKAANDALSRQPQAIEWR
jgi:very-short-patch-repair endonuclease